MGELTSVTDQLTHDTADQGDIMVKCIQLTKVFRDFWMRNRVRAVDGIDLEIRRGEVFGLLGPNGSGKSTTIKMILGLLYPTSGRVIVLGKTPDDVANKKAIGFLPEETYLYKFLNARETLDYYGRLFNLPRHTRKARIDELLHQVELEHAQYRPVGELSKGMQRKVGLAQALINDPDFLILDEPTSGMDPIATASVKRLIKILAARGKTILLCSHLLPDVEDVCERAAIMFGGKILETGTIDQLLVQQDRTTIRTSQLSPETIEKIEQVLAGEGKHIERVENPRQSLDAKFLNIVKAAQAKVGSRAGNVAGFLTETPTDKSKSVIDQLITGDTEPKAPVTEPASQAQTPPQSAAISDLVKTAPTTEPVTSHDTGETPSERPSTAIPPLPPLPSTQNADFSVIDNLIDPYPNPDTPKDDLSDEKGSTNTGPDGS